jgi:adenine-specific DNA-methyltransferase
MAAAKKPKRAETYRHEEEALLRPEVGTQAQFRKKKPPKTYRYDSSLSPALDWDGENSARELGEWLLAQIEEASALEPPFAFDTPRRFGDVEVAGLHDAIARLKALSRPFLDWAGKAERLSFDAPTLPLFVHERLSTKAILETLTGHKRDRQMELQLFADPQLSLAQQLEAYEHKGGWVNRMILGDSLVVMNSLLEYEGLGGQVQMIYIDPPYGVKFGSNFQPFVRKRDVKDGDDASFTREPEMVKAYRDTWELGLHSYLSYLRDRLLIARELLTPSGSVFVQISDSNVHHVREVLDEVFGSENAMTTIVFQKTSAEEAEGVANTADYILWYAKSAEVARARPLYRPKRPGEEGARQYIHKFRPDGEYKKLTPEEIVNPSLVGEGWRIGRRGFPLTSQDYSPTRSVPFEFEGKSYTPGANRHWSVNPDTGMAALAAKGRIYSTGRSLNAVMYLDEVPVTEIGNVWQDTGTGSFTEDQIYVVQTSERALERCVLLATEPGDLVLDPTCGGGTSAYVAEKWGRRWITIDTSRVPITLARQRLLTAIFRYFRLLSDARGPASGFKYETADHSQNRAADGAGVALHNTLSSIAGEEPPEEIVLVDRPEIDYTITRVTGPFVVEATIPTPLETDEEAENTAQAVPEGSYADRMLEALRRSPVIQLPGNRQIAMKNIRPPARSLSFSAEAALEPDGQPVAIVFGPENGAVGERLVNEAVREAYAKSYEQLLVIGFAIEPNAREFVDKAENLVGIPVTYVQATPDLVMGDLLKTMRSSQIFSVTGLPDVAVRRAAPAAKGEPERYEVELRGLDVFDPSDMSVDHRSGDDVPAWFLDTDYNGMVFHVSQAFFPRTGAWDSLKKSLKGELEDTVWDHLAGTTSAPFEAGDTGQIAVKVIDDRGNELLVVKPLAEAD